MKLLVLSSRFPLPLEKGDKLRIYHQLKYLSKDHEITLIALSDHHPEETWLQEMNQICRKVHVIYQAHWKSVVNAILAYAKGQPASVGYFEHMGSKQVVQKIIDVERPDIIYVQLIRMVPYVTHVTGSKVALDYMDAFSLRAIRRAERSSGIVQWFWRRESDLLRKFEVISQSKFNHRFIISNTDKEHLEEAGVTALTLLPNGVDTEYFKPNHSEAPQYDLVFVGNMSYHPNILAAKYLVQQIARHLKQKLPELKILIAGASPSREVLLLQNDWIKVTGYLEDIRTAYSNGKVFVAPIFTGSGLQNKILEAMAMEVPCVTTSIVADGIGAPQALVRIAGDIDSFCREIEALLEHEDERKSLGCEARKFVTEQFAWEQCCSPLDLLADPVKNQNSELGLEHK